MLYLTLLIIVSIVAVIILHRRIMIRYYAQFHGDKAHSYPMWDTMKMALSCAIVAFGVFLFVRKFPMLATIPIAFIVAILATWTFNQTVTMLIRAVCVLSLVPAALSVIAKMVLDDKTHAVSIGSIVLSGVLPIIICYVVGLLRYLYIEGYFMKKRSKAEIYAELRNIDRGSIKYKQLKAQLARLEKKASRKRSSDSRWAKFKTGYAPEEPIEEEAEDAYENIYSDSSLMPSDTGTSDGNKKFYYIVFGIVALIIAVCVSIVLINL